MVSRTSAPARLCHDEGVPTTVVIADDHPSFRASARAILEADGFDVIGEAADGAEALTAVRELCPDGLRPAVVLVSSRDASDYGSLIGESGARGFIAKADLSGDAVSALIA